MISLSLMNEGTFLLVLIWAAWQDWKRRSISLNGLLTAGSIGFIFTVLLERSCTQIVMSCGIGILLLILGKCTDGGIGDGDGWFFLVSGLYMDWQENLRLFLSGLFLCFGVSLILIVKGRLGRGRRGMKLPFLPFLLPTGIEMISVTLRLLQ